MATPYQEYLDSMPEAEAQLVHQALNIASVPAHRQPRACLLELHYLNLQLLTLRIERLERDEDIFRCDRSIRNLKDQIREIEQSMTTARAA